MEEVKHSLVSTIAKYLNNLRYLAIDDKSLANDLMVLLISDEIFDWASWAGMPSNEQLKLKKFRKNIIRNNPKIIEELEITNDYYKNVNIPQTIYTWQRVYDDFNVITINDVSKTIKYGRLYNWYAATDPRGIAPTGWHVPVRNDWEILLSNYQTTNDARIALLESGQTHWIPENNSTNSSNFTVVPSGHLSNTIGYVSKGYDSKFLYLNGNNTRINGLHVNIYDITWDVESDNIDGQGGNDIYAIGKSIRLIKDNSINEGDIIIDGDTYNTVKIGDQVWLQQNLAVKHYQNGDIIGNDFSGIEGAVTAYDNDETNVYN